jgi:hypothetical protein
LGKGKPGYHHYRRHHQPFARFVDARYSDEEHDAMLRKLQEARECDKDSSFTIPITPSLLSVGDAKEAAIQLLKELGVTAQGTNMSLERLLLLIKNASPKKHGRAPHAARLCQAGALGQLMKRHLDTGGSDRRVHASRPELVADGVKVRARGCKQSARRGTVAIRAHSYQCMISGFARLQCYAIKRSYGEFHQLEKALASSLCCTSSNFSVAVAWKRL